jgi:hypothetical protein
VNSFTNNWYPQWDSNPHWIDFKSIASADWAMGAYLLRLAKQKGGRDGLPFVLEVITS